MTEKLNDLINEFIEDEPVATDYEGSEWCIYCNGDFGYNKPSEHEEDCLWMRFKRIVETIER